MISFEGEPIDPACKQALNDFAAKLAHHPHGGAIDGRIVHAKAQPAGITETMRLALQMYMKDDEYLQWEAAQVGRTVATGGKTFVADDEVVTAVLHPMPGMSQEFLDLGAHELTEMAKLLRQQHDQWVRPDDPDEADGIVLFDEYCNERIRRDPPPAGLAGRQARCVAWTRLNDQRHCRAYAEETLRPPPPEFWPAWLNLGQVWAMVGGRGATGSASAERELTAWAEHNLVADQGWTPIAMAMDGLYQQPGLDRDQLAHQAATGVRQPIIAYGRQAWRDGP